MKPTAMITYDPGHEMRGSLADTGIEGNDAGQSSMPEDIYNAPYARKMAILRALGWRAELEEVFKNLRSIAELGDVEGPPRCAFDSSRS